MLNSIYLYSTFITYMLVVLYIGYWAYARTQNVADFYIGGRKLGASTAALSSGASDMSGWLLLGLPGYAYASGIEASWLALGLLVGCFANWQVVAKRLRQKSEELQSITIPEYLQKSAEPNGVSIQRLSAVIILIFFTLYTSSGLVAAGKLFVFVFDFDYQWAVLVGAVAVASYTLFGGFLAVSMTDVLQSLLMFLALVVVAILCYFAVTTDTELVPQIQQLNPHLLNPLTDNNGKALTWITLVSLMAWGIGYCGQPHVLARFKAIVHSSQVPKARNIAVSWSAVCLIAAIAIGLLGKVYFTGGTSVVDAEKIFMQLISALFHPLAAGILLSAILAAIMSTADSQLLVAASALTRDLLPQNKYISPVGLGRLTVVFITLCAAGNALIPGSSVLAIVSYAWAGFGAAFGPAIIYTLYGKKMSGNAVLAAIVVGTLTVVLWKQLSGGLFDLYEIVPGFVFASLAIVITLKIERQK